MYTFMQCTSYQYCKSLIKCQEYKTDISIEYALVLCTMYSICYFQCTRCTVYTIPYVLFTGAVQDNVQCTTSVPKGSMAIHSDVILFVNIKYFFMNSCAPYIQIN